MRVFRVSEDYSVAYPNPIKLAAGDRLQITKRETNPEWLGWVFCVREDGVGGWVSETYLSLDGDHAVALRAYDATELAVSKNELVEKLHEEFGWAWVRNAKSQEGWIPLQNLLPVELNVRVRDIEKGDIPFICNYWYHSPPGFIESIGVDTAKLPSEDDFAKSLNDKIESNRTLPESKLNALAIVVDERAIGFHTLGPIIEGDFGVFHAHLWNQEMRKKGIALRSYILAAKIFISRFSLKKIVYKTPVQNTGAIRVKEKLGLRCISTETIDFGIVKAGTQAKVFELTSDELARL